MVNVLLSDVVQVCQVSGESVMCTVDLPAWSSGGLSLNILKLSRFQQPREQLEKQLKEMSGRNELLEAELGKANNQIQLLTGKHSKLYCQILKRGRLSIET